MTKCDAFILQMGENSHEPCAVCTYTPAATCASLLIPTRVHQRTFTKSQSAFNYVAVEIMFMFVCVFFSLTICVFILFAKLVRARSLAQENGMAKEALHQSTVCVCVCAHAAMEENGAAWKKCTNEHELKVWKQLYVFITCWNSETTNSIRALRTMTTATTTATAESVKAKSARWIPWN